MTDLSYSDYIRVPELLDLQDTRSQTDDPLTRVCEHFFIVTHQATELWLSQVLLDLEEAGLALASGRYPEVGECLDRSVAVLEVMTASLEALASMPPGRFADFRTDLGTASGSQSSQFVQLDLLLGLGPTGDGPLVDALTEACRVERTTLQELLRDDGSRPELSRIALSMLDVSRKVWKWRAMHLELVSKMIGRRRGTGGSSGAEYLLKRLKMPFDPIWSAVSDIHDETAADREAAGETDRLEEAVRRPSACPVHRGPA